MQRSVGLARNPPEDHEPSFRLCQFVRLAENDVVVAAVEVHIDYEKSYDHSSRTPQDCHTVPVTVVLQHQRVGGGTDSPSCRSDVNDV